MKRILYIIAIVWCLTIELKAQVNHGLRAGIEIINFKGSEVHSSNYMPAFTGGYSFNYEIIKNFSIQPEANFIIKGASNDMELKGFPFSKITLSYLQVPVLFNLSSKKILNGLKASFFAGPAIDLFIVQDADGRMIETDPNNTKFSLVQDPKPLTYDMIFGFKLNKDYKYFIDMRYSNGITSFYENVDAKSIGISITIGILL